MPYLDEIYYESDQGRYWARCEQQKPNGTYGEVRYYWKYVPRLFDGRAWNGFVWQRYWIGRNDSRGRPRSYRTRREAQQ